MSSGKGASRAICPGLSCIGFTGGLLGAIVKPGWEVASPPRKPERNAVNLPQTLPEQIGLPEVISRATIEFSGWELPLSSFFARFGLSIAFGVFYCSSVERWPLLTLWRGTAFGAFLWVFFHVLLLPLLGTVPPPWEQPWQEHFPELFGRTVWMWPIGLVPREASSRGVLQRESVTSSPA